MIYDFESVPEKSILSSRERQVRVNLDQHHRVEYLLDIAATSSSVLDTAGHSTILLENLNPQTKPCSLIHCKPENFAGVVESIVKC